jgi:hypothetical protein
MYMNRTDSRTNTVVQEWMCADVWNIILMSNLSLGVDGVQKATENLRNETVPLQHTLLQLTNEAIQMAKNPQLAISNGPIMELIPNGEDDDG